MRSSADPPAARTEAAVERSQAHFGSLVDAPDERAFEPGRGGGARDRAKSDRRGERPDRQVPQRRVAERRPRDGDGEGGGDTVSAREDDAPASWLCTLGPNATGATHLAFGADGIGALAGPGMDIGLWDGGFGAGGDWIAGAGAGLLYGRDVTLRPDPAGAVLTVRAGADGAPEAVTARLGTMALEAAVVAVARR